MSMTEYRLGNAIVRIHGEPNREAVEAAMIRMLKKAEARKKQGKARGDIDQSRNV